MAVSGKPERITRNRIWGLGVYVNPEPYRYLAVQVGPWWIYLWHEAFSAS